MAAHRRTAFIGLGTAVLVLATTLVGALPAQAASYRERGDTKIAFYGSSRQQVDTYSAKGIVRGSGAAVSLKWQYRAPFYIKQTLPKNSTISLQRKVNSKWFTIKSIKPKKTSRQTITAEIPAYTVPAGVPSQIVKYRVKVKKSGKVIKGDTSGTITIKYENQSMYTGLALTQYQAMAPYCPTATVRIDASLASRDRAGEFNRLKGIYIDPTVSSYTPAYQASVALHECAHMRQFYNWGASYVGDAKMKKSLAKTYVNDVNPDPAVPTPPVVGTFDPIEHSADCASIAINPGGYLGYGGYCNPTEQAAGVALMQGQRI
jgi:hypothetical protein